MGPFAFVSRNGTRIIAIAAGAGLLLPQAAEALRPHIGHLVVAMLTVSLLRVDLAAFAARLRRPASAIAATIWITLVLPLVLLGVVAALGPPLSSPLVLAALFLFAVPPPIVSAPAFAMLMGLDGAMVLALLLAGLASMPMTAPAIAALFVADTMPIGAFALALRLAGMIAAAFLAATLLRAVLGGERIAHARPILDTIAVSIAILFAIGAMEGVGLRLVDAPLATVAFMAGAFAFLLAQMAVTLVVFRPFVGVDAVAIAYAAGNRNAGLVVAGLGATAVDDGLWFFFALSQLPIFIFPLVLTPVGRRLAAPAARPTAI